VTLVEKVGVGRREVAMAVGQLPEEFQTAIVLVDVDKYSYEDAAKLMGCPIGTVRSRVYRGRRILEGSLKHYAAKRDFINEYAAA